ncbi:serine-threonine protein kinase [Streptomyces sp. A7024]|uniref:Serine-threonine protein kinase n=1 Tax=Streptomyces coryli TaxID=1128680 RepID=A0A6G4U3I6_9ACTN|nr:serine-threonine protein kinase [Streptomyces coryli]
MSPYWELTFDAEGDVNAGQRSRIERQAAAEGVTDLLFFSHGWNNDRSIATRLYSRFFAPFPGLAEPGQKLGYVGVLWPAMRFTDEPIPDFPAAAAPPGRPGRAPDPGLDETTRRVLGAQFPGRVHTVARISELLTERPEGEPERYAEFLRLLRRLLELDPNNPTRDIAPDMADEPAAAAVPLALAADSDADAEAVFAEFAAALDQAAPDPQRPAALWDGGRELLRQATYYAMKRRAGTIGQRGLGPALIRIAKAAPDARQHLIGHSFGARLVSYALRALPATAGQVGSVTLLQGAFSHYAFAPKLPHDKGQSGALNGMQRRVAGPVVSCYSEHDGALRTFYPLAARMARDDQSLLPGADRWGAIGFAGIKAVTGCKNLTLKEALAEDALPAKGCVSVNAAAVVKRGGGPVGAHSDICHKELARLVLAAGRAGR